jgi:hypothetical protein
MLDTALREELVYFIRVSMKQVTLNRVAVIRRITGALTAIVLYNGAVTTRNPRTDYTPQRSQTTKKLCASHSFANICEIYFIRSARDEIFIRVP